jgi:alkylated DNA repair dioxygenase AlkB
MTLITDPTPTTPKSSGIQGLTYQPEYIDATLQDRLIQIIDQQPWLSDLQRRVQHYGYRYDYKARKVDPAMYLGPLPDWAAEIAARLHREGWFPVPPDQLIVNEYQPGQGIAKHVDCVPCFDSTVSSLSLGSSCVMEFANTKLKQKIPVFLEPRSMVILQEEARYKWTHAVPARKSDEFEGRTFPRARRLSLTFRKVLLRDS